MIIYLMNFKAITGAYYVGLLDQLDENKESKTTEFIEVVCAFLLP